MFGYRGVLLVCFLAVYAALLFLNPARIALRDGWRCLKRFPALWGILTVFGLSYALFQLALRVFYGFLLPEGQRPAFHWHRAWFLPKPELAEVAKTSVLPSFESVAGLFNNLLTTYPLSAIAALLLLANWQGHTVVLRRALLRRFGHNGHWLFLFVLLCALAALIKPALYAGLPWLGHTLPPLLLLQLGSFLDWLSFLFEYLLGFSLQIYLILLAYVWVRGIHYTRAHLIDFAIRRQAALLQWAFLSMAISTLLIHFPLILANIPPFSHFLPPEIVIPFIDHFSRPLLAGFFILFATVQITLVFHTESLRDAARDNFHFLHLHGRAFAGYAAAALLHFYLLNLFHRAVVAGFGQGALLTLGWQLFQPPLTGLVSAWLIAAWVCLFHCCRTGHHPRF